ncbi:unnamed protein product [Didymodactylos carnosus]|uniref:Uncharacterized protein n=1 Tax=Didymodactylos carnosus TaxID=1234261 RepID=A0A813PV88_9BILA|nr:unnamed protein product [Didymodactylos carnosus]CAF0760733.1 unnamed protein product [Didymodactylos carnosus]CAF3504392.1 unnamed protein product [Didymodactylos carnosus]CAF3541569.1 unnamed protein product [Didymodactylos carnosus]
MNDKFRTTTMIVYVFLFIFSHVSCNNDLSILTQTTLSTTSVTCNQENKNRSGLIDDCNCRFDDINDINNKKLYPILKILVKKNYFRFYPINLKKQCQFWIDDSKCVLKDCAVKSCPVDQLPETLRHNKNHHEYVKHRQESTTSECSSNNNDKNSSLGELNKNLSDEHKQTIEKWIQFDDSLLDNFCDIDDETSADVEYIDLLLNKERYTGYSGQSTKRIWTAIYNENCFFMSGSKVYYNLRQKRQNIKDLCLEGRIFYRLISGLHSSISIHLCSNYFFPGYLGLSDHWGPNTQEFSRRFDPKQTEDEGPLWLKNLYFIYLIELRALDKAIPYLEQVAYFTGNETDDEDTKNLLKNQLFNEIRKFANHFNETHLFKDNEQLRYEFKEHFRNISRIMDCVGCDKCKIWGKLQIQALGTALKILFNRKEIHAFQLQRSEIVSLINGFAQLSYSIDQLEKTFKPFINIS